MTSLVNQVDNLVMWTHDGRERFSWAGCGDDGGEESMEALEALLMLCLDTEAVTRHASLWSRLNYELTVHGCLYVYLILWYKWNKASDDSHRLVAAEWEPRGQDKGDPLFVPLLYVWWKLAARGSTLSLQKINVSVLVSRTSEWKIIWK